MDPDDGAAARKRALGPQGTAPSNQPEVGDGLRAKPGRWSFGGDVSRVFEQHIRRSLPMHEELHRLVLRVAPLFTDDGVVYDLGCSTGALCHQLRRQLPRAEIIGVDGESTMIETAQAHVPDVTFIHQDVRSAELKQCDLVVCLYTLQFLPVDCRPEILRKISQQLRPGGALIFAEKVVRSDRKFEQLCRSLHHRFKREQGFTHSEIEAKSKAIEGVLIPVNESLYPSMLKDAGFQSTNSVMRHTSFEAWISIK